MTVRTAKDKSSVHNSCPEGYTFIDGPDMFEWSFGSEEVQALQKDDSGQDLYSLIDTGKEGRRFFGPDACSVIFFAAVEALYGRDEKDPAWRLCDAVLVSAHNAAVYQTGMEIAA